MSNPLLANSLKSTIFNLLIVLILTSGGISYFFYGYMPSATLHGQTVTVPDMQNMSFEDAQKIAEESNLSVSISDSVFSKDIPPSHVISQFPASGNLVKPERNILLTINTQSAPEIKVPDIIDGSRKSAELILENFGLNVVDVEYVPDLAANAVLRLKIDGEEIDREALAKGVSLAKGTDIILIVGDGLGKAEQTVPQLKGLMLTEAEEVLRSLGLHVGKIKYTNSTKETGIILNQYPKHSNSAGIKIGSNIDLWVSNFDETATEDETGVNPEVLDAESDNSHSEDKEIEPDTF